MSQLLLGKGNSWRTRVKKAYSLNFWTMWMCYFNAHENVLNVWGPTAVTFRVTPLTHCGWASTHLWVSRLLCSRRQDPGDSQWRSQWIQEPQGGWAYLCYLPTLSLTPPALWEAQCTMEGPLRVWRLWVWIPILSLTRFETGANSFISDSVSSSKNEMSSPLAVFL